MSTIKQNHGVPFQITATHATSAVCTKIPAASTALYITDLSGSSDKSGALILVKDDSTTIWQDIIGAGNYVINFVQPIKCVGTLTVTVDGTSLCKSNVSGFVGNLS